MPDQLEELFAGLRAEAIAQIRPPGVAAARQTVHRRRVRSRTAVVCALLVVFAGLAGLPRLGRPATRRPLPQNTLEQLAEVARQAVLQNAPAPAALADQGPVRADYTMSHSPFLGQLTLSGACAGAGTVTVLVSGTRSGEDTSSGRPELARLVLTCRAGPVAAEVPFVTGRLADFRVELIDAGSAAGRSGFAYRVTSDTGTPVAADDDRANPTTALHLSDPLPAGSGWGGSGSLPGGTTMRPGQPARLTGKLKVAVACAGTGHLRFEVHRGDTTVKEFSFDCTYPPVRKDLAIGDTGGADYDVGYTYDSPSQAPANVAFQFLPQ